MSVRKSVQLPNVLFERWQKIQPYLGYISFTSFVRAAVREKLLHEEIHAEHRIDKEIEKRREETEF